MQIFESIGVDELLIVRLVRHPVVKALTNIYLLSNFRKLPKTTIRAPSSGEMGVVRIVYLYRFQDPKKGKLNLTFNWPKFFELRIYGYLMNLYSVSIQ